MFLKGQDLQYYTAIYNTIYTILYIFFLFSFKNPTKRPKPTTRQQHCSFKELHLPNWLSAEVHRQVGNKPALCFLLKDVPQIKDSINLLKACSDP